MTGHDCVALSNQDILTLWEMGDNRHDADKALLMAAAAYPNLDWQDLIHLPLGRRDCLIIRLRQKLLGDALAFAVQCPQCQQPLEFDASSDELLQCCPSPDSAPLADFNVGSYNIQARPLDSLDLTTVQPGPSRAAQRLRLISRTLQKVTLDGDLVSSAHLPEEVVSVLGAKLLEADPAADLSFSLNCPDCGHPWTVTFDITSYFWKELSAMARAMLEDVHTLASAYGWAQSDILSLSPTRRAFYVSKIKQ